MILLFELLSGALFSISANIDNISIGLSYGVKKVHISILKNIIICVFTSCATFLSMIIGQNIANLFDIKITNMIGSILLIFLGIYPLFKKIYKICRNNKRCIKEIKQKERQNNNYITLKELIAIILTLSLNNIAAGIAASITGVNVISTTICTFIFGSIFLFIGNNLGKKINNKLVEKYSEIISSIILILIGIMELFI